MAHPNGRNTGGFIWPWSVGIPADVSDVGRGEGARGKGWDGGQVRQCSSKAVLTCVHSPEICRRLIRGDKLGCIFIAVMDWTLVSLEPVMSLCAIIRSI